jgi:hypothetical protein
MPSRRRRVATAALATTIVLLLAAGAAAADPYEPNDAPETAAGPLGAAGGLHAVAAAVETAADEDWFALFVPEGEQDVALELAPERAGDALCLRLHVEEDGLATELASVQAAGGVPGSGALAYTVTGPARVLAAVDGCAGAAPAPAPYRLTLQGDWPAADPRPGDVLPAAGDAPAAGGDRAARCHAAAVSLRAAARRQRAARRALRRHPGGQSRRRMAAARRARAGAIRRVVRRC